MQVTLPLFPNHKISLRLFENVTNAGFILERLKSADKAYDYCFLDCRHLIGIEQVLCATTRALRDARDGEMRTKTLYSEIVYSLSPNQNITEALKEFGVADNSTALLCLAIDNELDTSLVTGSEVEVTNETLARLCDRERTKTIYKLSRMLIDVNEIHSQVITAIAMRGNL